MTAVETGGQGRFGPVLRAEWTKFRTVRGWVVGMLAAAAAIVGFGLFPGMQGSCGQNGPGSACSLPVGPGGEEVVDNFFFVHRPLAGDGSITVRVTSLTGLLPDTSAGRPGPAGQDPDGGTRPGLVPWAKAGLIVKADTRAGSAYAAVLITGAHGVRMQYDYTGDIAGSAGAASASSPRWLRLTRRGDTLTGEESADGSHWSRLGTAVLTGLPSTVQAGLFTTSPQYAASAGGTFSASSVEGGPSQATAAFDHLDRQGGWPAGSWTGEHLGGPGDSGPFQPDRFEQTAGGFTVTGSGDIAPAVAGAAGLGVTITQTLVGTFIGLIVVVVVGAMFVTAEYRRGLIRTTLAATPRRGRVLAAKALVLGAVTFGAGLAAAAVVVTAGQRVLRSHGVYVHPATALTQLRVAVGSAALLAVAAVLALAVGSLLRRSAPAVATAIAGIVVPYLLAITVLPAGAGQWLLRITPAAAFAIQQSTRQYFQVSNIYTPANGYYPLPPWAGLAVLCGWAGLALGLAVVLTRRRDA